MTLALRRSLFCSCRVRLAAAAATPDEVDGGGPDRVDNETDDGDSAMWLSSTLERMLESGGLTRPPFDPAWSERFGKEPEEEISLIVGAKLDFEVWEWRGAAGLTEKGGPPVPLRPSPVPAPLGAPPPGIMDAGASIGEENFWPREAPSGPASCCSSGRAEPMTMSSLESLRIEGRRAEVVL